MLHALHSDQVVGEVAQLGRLAAQRHHLEQVGIAGPHVVLAHVVHTEEAERDSLAKRGTRVAHCPSSNLKLASGVCPVPEYLTRGIHVSIGADGAPCNDRLDAFNRYGNRPYHLSFSMGCRVYDVHSRKTAAEFQREIDELMYEHKRQAHAASAVEVTRVQK